MWENLRMYAPAAQAPGDRIPISIYLLYHVQACSKSLREFFYKEKMGSLNTHEPTRPAQFSLNINKRYDIRYTH
jgi:hypothetical protein